MRVEKSFTIAAPMGEVWEFVSSPEKVGMCFPGCENVTAVGEDKYQATVKVHVGPIRTVFNVEFEEVERRPGEYSAYTSRGEEGNRASRLKVNSDLTLSPIDGNRTQVDYTSEVKIVGRLGKFGSGIMKKKADALGEEFVQSLRAHIEGPPAREVVVEAPATEFRVTPRQRVLAIIVAAAAAALLYLFLAH